MMGHFTRGTGPEVEFSHVIEIRKNIFWLCKPVPHKGTAALGAMGGLLSSVANLSANKYRQPFIHIPIPVLLLNTKDVVADAGKILL